MRPPENPFPTPDAPMLPVVGEYGIVASTLTPPEAGAAGRSVLGYGPVQFLGVFDTMPSAPEWQMESHRALAPKASSGGVTLRWATPRQTRIDQPGTVQTLNPAFANAIALTLYVGGLDVLPSPQTWRSRTWPGFPVGSTPFAFSKATQNVPSIWQTGLAFVRPQRVGDGAFAPGPSGQFGTTEQQSGFDWLRLIGGQPALDLLSYAGAPWVEADLWELAGGTRYVAAWLRMWWSRYEGTNELTEVNYRIPYTLRSGRALNPCHRHAWHVSLPVVPKVGVNAEADVYAGGSRLQVSSPIGGRWRIGAENNGIVGDNDVFIGLELRGSTVLERDAMAVGPTDHGLVIATDVAHGGAAVISAGVPTGGQVDACLVNVSVTGLA